MCKLLLAPVKNESLEVILFILNFDELNEQLDTKAKRFSKRNRLLQQIGMPFISSIFVRSPSPTKSNNDNQRQSINDPFKFLDQKFRPISESARESLPLNNSLATANKPSQFDLY